MRSVSAAGCCRNVNVVIFFPILQNLQCRKTNWRHISKHILALGLTAEGRWWGLISPTGWHSQAYRAWPNQKTSTIAGATVRGKSHPLISTLLRKQPSRPSVHSLQVALFSMKFNSWGIVERQGPDLFSDSCMLWYDERGSFGRVTRLQKYSRSVYFQWSKFVIIRAGGLIPTQ